MQLKRPPDSATQQLARELQERDRSLIALSIGYSDSRKGIPVAVLFYRVENSDNMGPYNGENVVWEMIFQHSFGLSHPGPRGDGIQEFNPPFDVCGFATFEMMIDWFKGWGDQLEETGYRVNVYRVAANTMVRGRRQAIIDYRLLNDKVESYSPAGM